MTSPDAKEAPSLVTAEGMIAFAENYGERLRAMFNETGKTLPVVGVVATWDPEHQCNYEPPLAMVMAMPDLAEGPGYAAQVDSKQQHARFTRFLITESKAIGVVTAFEVWISSDEKYRGRDFREDPNRKEAIFVMAEHIRLPKPFLRRGWIVRDANGKVTAEPFHSLGDEVTVKGRFVDLLQRARFA